jgi:hypothetical protein
VALLDVARVESGLFVRTNEPPVPMSEVDDFQRLRGDKPIRVDEEGFVKNNCKNRSWDVCKSGDGGITTSTS